MAAKDKISRLLTQLANVGEATVEQNRIGAYLNAQTNPFIFIADAVGQAGQLSHSGSKMQNAFSGKVKGAKAKIQSQTNLVRRTVTVVVLRIVEAVTSTKKQAGNAK